MKKHLFYTVLTVILLVFGSNSMFAQDAKDKYDAMNDYMEKAVEDTTKEIIIIKEKIKKEKRNIKKGIIQFPQPIYTMKWAMTSK